jgi:diketogulonate reductase-like aldo/keto reductase
MTATRTIGLPSGEAVPVLGLSTWGYAEEVRTRATEIATVRMALDLGMTLIDTAELYAGGAAEELVGEALAGRRDEAFLVTKVLPFHATREGTIEACRRSLRRLRTDRIDLYLLHWRGAVPLGETLDAFATLREAGSIRHWGVANFDVADLAELLVLGGADVAADEVLYNLAHREAEHDLIPWCLERGIPLMTYLPLEGGRLLGHPALDAVAARHGATPAQVALAWVLRHERLATLPAATTPSEAGQSHAALDLHLTVEDLSALDDAFPRPLGPRPLDVH